MLVYPGFDPVALELGPLKVRWYGLTYLIAFAVAWWLARRRAAQPGSTWKVVDVDDFLFFAMLGVILGGRIGYTLFYGMEFWRQDPLYLLRVWEGGMSFHGGLIGVLVALALFAKRRGRRVADVFDFAAALPGIGIFAVRVGNFINGELWGRPGDVPWAMLVDGVARHPTQLYEALLEGALLAAVLWWFTSKPRPQWAPSALFLILYASGRLIVEFWRLPDAHIGYLAGGWLTMGHVLTLPMLLAGVVLLLLAYRRDLPSGNRITA
jgi:phosphatidylglycerol:prolipoprotein diacylglycerol transferase